MELQRLSVFSRYSRAGLPLSIGLVVLSSYGAEPSIEIKGGTKALRDNIRQHLTIDSESCKTPIWRLNAMADVTEREVTAGAQALGYYHLTYEAQWIGDQDCWGLKLTLTPGDPVRVNALRMTVDGDGRDDKIFDGVFSDPGIRVGNRLHHGNYENLKSRFSNLATSHGYFDGDFSLSRIEIHKANRLADIDLHYATGERYRIGDIHLTHDILDTDFLKRYYNIEEGDYYDADKLFELKSMYSSSNYFSVVNVAPALQSIDNKRVPIHIDLTARKRRAYSAGVGVESDEPRIKLGFEDRYINRRGHSFKADLSSSEIKQEATANYKVPLRSPAFEYMNVFAGYRNEETKTFTSTKTTYGVNYTEYQQSKWLQTYSLEYLDEESQIGSVDLGRIALVIPSIAVSRTKTDGDVYPKNGWSLLSKLSGSAQSIGGDRTYVQFYGRGKYIHSVGRGRILVRGEVGATDMHEQPDDLPASTLFFAGGDASVRGYEYKSLGPAILNTANNKYEVIGGKNLAVASIEYDYRFRDSNWVAAVFYDQGNSANGSDFELKRGAGIGARWISPIGPIRIDVAHGFDPIGATGKNGGWRLHISMGPDL